VTPMITGMTKHFTFHISWIYIHYYYYYYCCCCCCCCHSIMGTFDIRVPTRQIRECFNPAWAVRQDMVLQLGASLLQITYADFWTHLAKHCLLWGHFFVFVLFSLVFIVFSPLYLFYLLPMTVIGSCRCWVSTLK
jgi:hypothetical protein